MKKTALLLSLLVLAGCADPAVGGDNTIERSESEPAARDLSFRPKLKNADDIGVGVWVFPHEVKGRPFGGDRSIWNSYYLTVDASSSDELKDVFKDMPGALFGDNPSIPFKSGKREGVWTARHANGQKAMEGTFEADKAEGAWTAWYEDGQKAMEGTFEADKAEGVWTAWHENGQKTMEGTFKVGRREGVWTYWDEQGNVTKTETYKNGELVK